MAVDIKFSGVDDGDVADLYIMPREVLEEMDPDAGVLQQLDHPIIAIGRGTVFGFSSPKDAAEILVKAATMMDPEVEAPEMIVMGSEEFAAEMRQAFINASKWQSDLDRLMTGPAVDERKH